MSSCTGETRLRALSWSVVPLHASQVKHWVCQKMNHLEERFYEIAALEVAQRRLIPAAMARAFSEADGDERKAIARYIKVRVQQLHKEHEAELCQQKQQQAEEKKQRVVALQEAAETAGRVLIACPKCDNSELLPRGNSYVAMSSKNFDVNIAWLSNGFTAICVSCKHKFRFSPPPV